VSSREIAGYRISKAWAKEQKVYFVARFSRPFSSSIVLDMAKNPREAAPKVNSKSIVGIFDFGNSGPVVVTVGISFSSVEDAAKNLENECPHYDFDKIKTETQQKWQRQLSKIEVEGGSEAEKTIFYTALYHTMIVPNEKAAPSNGGSGAYTVFSLWDTYRACNPLYTIIEPTRTKGFIQTFLDHYEAFGRLPVWELAGNETDCMIGNHAIPVIADAYLKGIRGFDAELALEAMIKSVNTDLFGLKWYKELGYIPADKESESVSKTLEYAYDDWCIAQMAERMGKKDIAAQYRRRAMNFFHIFDPETGFFRAKSNGTWQKPFNPYEVNFHFTLEDHDQSFFNFHQFSEA
jgi:predicted alpha-1,2-mannosidase